MLLHSRILLVLSFLGACSVASENQNFSSYLFAYFTGNSGNQEAIRFALSDDAHTFKALNKNNPVLNSATISSTGGVRDPHILRGENNDYYMVATDMVSAQGWASNRGLVMLKSNNLTDWTSSKVNIPKTYTQYSAADRVWAPQSIYDQKAKKYMVYFAMRLGPSDADKIYYAYADSSFTKFESAPKLLYSYKNLAAIDADIIYKDSIYYLFFKNEGTGNGIKSATSKTLTGEYVLNDKYLQQTNAQVEGSCVFKLINSDKYILMYDVYTSGRYEFATSTDLKNFTKDPAPISFDFSPRHGTVIPITSAEKKALQSKWDPTQVNTVTQKKLSKIKTYQQNGFLNFDIGNFRSSGMSVIMSDLRGRIFFQKAVLQGTYHIDITGLKSGMYHIFYKDHSGIIDSEQIVVR